MIEDLLPIGLLIVVAKLLKCLLDRIGLSSIVAYTAAGTLLGPVAGIVEPTNKLQVFLGISVFILFFLVGLDEIDIPGFVATLRGRFFYAAILSVVISMVAAMMVTSDLFGVGFALALHFRDALALAGILSMSSLGLVAKVLADKGYLKEPLGLEIFYHGHHCGDDHATGCGIQHRRTHHRRARPSPGRLQCGIPARGGRGICGGRVDSFRQGHASDDSFSETHLQRPGVVVRPADRRPFSFVSGSIALDQEFCR